MKLALNSIVPRPLKQRGQAGAVGAVPKKRGSVPICERVQNLDGTRAGHSRASSGMSLVEVTIAVALIAISATALMGSLSYGTFEIQLLRENQRATQILLEKTETIRLYRWDQVLTPGFIPTTFTDVYDPQAPTNSQGATYYGTLTIAPVSSTESYASNLVQLTITLSWNSCSYLNRTRKMCTYIAKDGLQNYVY